MLNKGKIIILGSIGLVVLVVLLGVLGAIPLFKHKGGDKYYPTNKITINVWGFDNRSAFSDIFSSYEKIHKNIKFTYRKFDSLDTYKKALVNGLAEGNGPDMFMAPSYWVEEYNKMMFPAYQNLISTKFVKYYYPDVVSSDLIRNGKIFAMPLYMDSLALFYNKDIFNARAVVFSPQTWNGFVKDIIKTRDISNTGKIIRAGSALGSSNNVHHMADILSVLMLQLGSNINKPNTSEVSFGNKALNALDFYLQFSNPLSSYYTWSDGEKDSVDAFASGNVAMIIDYRSELDVIKNKNPFLKIGIAPLPQANIYQPKNFANYMTISVSRNDSSSKAYVGWDFIRYLTTISSVNNIYLKNTNRLPALKTGIQKLLGGKDDVFARSFLSATSWRRSNWAEIQNIFKEMVSSVTSGKTSPERALRAAQNEINNIKN